MRREDEVLGVDARLMRDEDAPDADRQAISKAVHRVWLDTAAGGGRHTGQSRRAEVDASVVLLWLRIKGGARERVACGRGELLVLSASGHQQGRLLGRPRRR